MLTVMYVPISCDGCKLKPQTRGSEESRVERRECAGETNCVRHAPTLEDDHVSIIVKNLPVIAGLARISRGHSAARF
jgi:hypothetical protein